MNYKHVNRKVIIKIKDVISHILIATIHSKRTLTL